MLTGKPAVALLLVVLLAGACLTRQRDELLHAQDDYRECLRTAADRERDCAELKDEALALGRRYEQDGRMRWGGCSLDVPRCEEEIVPRRDR